MRLKLGALSAEVVGDDLLSVTSLRFDGTELLARPDELPAGYRIHGRRAGITLLHPWANRLGSDVYRFGDVQANLAGLGSRLTRDDNGLAIHGITAADPWQVREDGPNGARASLTWDAEPAFPFPHRVEVVFTLEGSENACLFTVHTSVVAIGGGPVPVALGWHPYFRCDRVAGAELQLPALRVLAADERGLPTGRDKVQDAAMIRLGNQSLDYGVAGMTSGSQMQLRHAQRTIAVTFGPGYSYGQVFAPDDAGIVSLEPMTAPTDALARGADLPVADVALPYRAMFAVRVEADRSEAS